MTEIPLAVSGPWDASDREAMRVGSAEVDARTSPTTLTAFRLSSTDTTYVTSPVATNVNPYPERLTRVYTP